MSGFCEFSVDATNSCLLILAHWIYYWPSHNINKLQSHTFDHLMFERSNVISIASRFPSFRFTIIRYGHFQFIFSLLQIHSNHSQIIFSVCNLLYQMNGIYNSVFSGTSANRRIQFDWLGLKRLMHPIEMWIILPFSSVW